VTTTTVPVARYQGLDALLRTLNSLPREANQEMRTRSKAIAAKHGQALKSAGSSHPDARVRGVAQTVRARSDRVPVIAIGGARRVSVSRGKPLPQAGDLLFGAEWGAVPDGPNGWRFPATSDGSWITPVLAARHPQVVREWQELYDDVQKRWARSKGVR